MVSVHFVNFRIQEEIGKIGDFVICGRRSQQFSDSVGGVSDREVEFFVIGKQTCCSKGNDMSIEATI